MKHSWTNYLIYLLALSWNSCVEGREVRSFVFSVPDEEEFEHRKNNGKKKKYKGNNNDLQIITHKTKN
jgi:hypothetical protein